MNRSAPSRHTHLAVPRALWLATAVGRSLSAAKEVSLAVLFGTSIYKDALVVAWALPTLLATYCNETLPALLTPRWAVGRPVGRRLPALVLALLVLLVVGVEVFPRAAVLALAPAFAGERLALAVRLVRWLAPAVALLGAEAILVARLNALRRFVWSPIGAGLPAAGALVALALSSRLADADRIVAVSAGLTCGAVAAVLILALVATGCTPLTPTSASADAPAFPTLRPMLSLLAAMALLNAIPWAEQAAASTLAPGSVAAFDYGERLVLFAFGLSVAPYTSVCFTHLSQAEGADFIPKLEAALRRLLWFTFPLAAALALGSPLWTRWAFGWGRFNAASLAATAPVVALLGAALPLDALVYFLLFALYARDRATAKLPLAAVLAGINVPLAFLGAAWGGVPGIALAHGAGYAIGVGWLVRRRQHLLPGLRWRAALWGWQADEVAL